MMRQPLQIRDVHDGRINFATNGSFTWATVDQLDRARFQIHKDGDAWIGSNAIVEADLNTLHNALRTGRVA